MTTTHPSTASRARGVLLGQAIGDNLGSVAEFATPAQLVAGYPNGVRELAGGARYGGTVLAPGQPTDDTELALALARSLVRCGGYRESDVRQSYRRWAASGPFDIGNTCAQALTPSYRRSESSESNGSLMRVSPLAVACTPERAAHFALVDASLTHANPYPGRVNACYAAALSDVVAGAEPAEALLRRAGRLRSEVEEFMAAPPDDVSGGNMGWVRFAFHLTCYYAANDAGFEEDLVAVVGMGGDADTNGAIVGAFLGGVHGEEGIPRRWRDAIAGFDPAETDRPDEYSVHDLAELADALLALREAAPTAP